MGSDAKIESRCGTVYISDVMAKGFISYSHKDEALRQELEAHLAPLRREGLIEVWHDRKIVAGRPVDKTIDRHLDTSGLILLLISSDFINSDYCHDVEVRRAMERHERGEAVVIPVILRPCEWRGMPFGHLLALPTDGKAVTSWANHDEAFHDVVRGIKAALQQLGQHDDQRTPGRGRRPGRGSSGQRAHAKAGTGPVSSNVRLPRTFSQQDRDDFLEKAFQHVARFVKNSLTKLERQNRDVKTRFTQLDARRFTAVAYQGGEPLARCTIWMGGRQSFVGGIGYVENDSGDTNSFNESLSVEADEDALYLRAMGMPLMGGSSPASKLTIEAAAEYLWSLFLRPLQRRP